MNEDRIIERIATAIEKSWDAKFDAWYKEIGIERPDKVPDPDLFMALANAAWAAAKAVIAEAGAL